MQIDLTQFQHWFLPATFIAPIMVTSPVPLMALPPARARRWFTDRSSSASSWSWTQNQLRLSYKVTAETITTFTIDLPLFQTIHIIDLISWSLSQCTKHNYYTDQSFRLSPCLLIWQCVRPYLIIVWQAWYLAWQCPMTDCHDCLWLDIFTSYLAKYLAIMMFTANTQVDDN